mmetsp:Transcript_40657/g.79528  ORF Transcript_40657/g.79528 Transcript_40657/m.79528 type:complete len:223 (+) Transcript_40657:326-994(+)
MKRVGVVEGCVASNYPRTIYGEDEWAVFQNAYNEINPKNPGDVGKNGFLIEYEVQNHPVRGRTIVTKEDIPRGEKFWDGEEWHATFTERQDFRNFLELLPMAYRCEILLWAYVCQEEVAVDLDPGSFFNHADDKKMINVSTSRAKRNIKTFIDFNEVPWFDKLRSKAWKVKSLKKKGRNKNDDGVVNHSTEGYNQVGAPKPTNKTAYFCLYQQSWTHQAPTM